MGSSTIATAQAFKDKGKLKSASKYTPQRGDIAYYGTGKTIDSINHVEIVTAVNADGSITTIGGNTGRNLNEY